MLNIGHQLLLQLERIVIGHISLADIGDRRLPHSGHRFRIQLVCQQAADFNFLIIDEIRERTEYLQKIPQRIIGNGPQIIQQLHRPARGFTHGQENLSGSPVIQWNLRHRPEHEADRLTFYPKQAEEEEGICHVIADAGRIAENIFLLQNRQIRLEFIDVKQLDELFIAVYTHWDA